MSRLTPAPRGEALRAVSRRRAGDAGYDAVATRDYTASTLPRTPQRLCSFLVTWLRCHACKRGYFAAGAPSPQDCEACAGDRLRPVGLWDLRVEAAPAGMVRSSKVTA
jgi:hypothetical protein